MKEVQRKIFLWLTCAIALVMPVYGRLLPLLIALQVLNWLAGAAYTRNFLLIFREKPRMILASFSLIYLFYLLGLAYTSNFRYAGEDLMIKLSLLLFPMILATSDFPLFRRNESWLILKFFSAGCVVGSLVLLERALYHTLVLGKSGAFYYTALSWNFHSGYYSMYLVFAFSNILWFLLIRKSVEGTFRIAFHVLILVLFTLMVVLLSSKSGLLIWLVTVCFYAFLLVFRYKKIWGGILFLGASLVLFTVFLALFPMAVSRVDDAREDVMSADFQKNEDQSISIRLQIWRSSWKIIRNHFFTGVGTGDVKDALMEQYRKHHLNIVFGQQLNAHNQFIQTFLTLGILGPLILAAMFLLPAIRSFRKEAWIYLVFLVITGISMLFESMLETQAGVVFYAFFNTFLFAMSHADPAGDAFKITGGEG